MKKHGSEAIRKRIVINYANAVKLGGNKDGAIKLLEQEDWSIITDDYKICLAAIRDDLSSVIKLMKIAVDSGAVQRSAYREWPVFGPIRFNADFIEAFEKNFGERFIIVKEAVALPTPSIEEQQEKAAKPRRKKKDIAVL